MYFQHAILELTGEWQTCSRLSLEIDPALIVSEQQGIIEAFTRLKLDPNEERDIGHAKSTADGQAGQ